MHLLSLYLLLFSFSIFNFLYWKSSWFSQPAFAFIMLSWLSLSVFFPSRYPCFLFLLVSLVVTNWTAIDFTPDLPLRYLPMLHNAGRLSTTLSFAYNYFRHRYCCHCFHCCLKRCIFSFFLLFCLLHRFFWGSDPLFVSLFNPYFPSGRLKCVICSMA